MTVLCTEPRLPGETPSHDWQKKRDWHGDWTGKWICSNCKEIRTNCKHANGDWTGLFMEDCQEPECVVRSVMES